MGDSLTYQTFAQYLNTKFQVQVDAAQSVDLELTEVSELKASPGQEQFTLVFRGPDNLYLGQGTREFDHDQMGRCDLFIVPIGKDEKGYYYEAVFNRFSTYTETAG